MNSKFISIHQIILQEMLEILIFFRPKNLESDFERMSGIEKFNGHELSDWFKANPGFLPDDKVEEFNSTLGDAVMYTADILDVADILE